MSSTSTKTPSLFDRFWAQSWKVKLISLLIVPVVLFYVGTLLLNLFNYSVGERTGVLSKISKKGVACWTTEGELAQPSFSKSSALRSGGAPIDNTFYFSVPDPDVRKQLDAVPPGTALSLQYEQKLFALDLPLPLLCQRRTQFQITGVRTRAGSPAGGVPGQTLSGRAAGAALSAPLYYLLLSPSRKAIASSSTRTASMTGITGRASNSKTGNIEQNL